MRKHIASFIVGIAPALITPTASGDDWGCQVLLCLSNPGGATQFGECVGPIEKLYRHLAKGRGFPTCDLAGSPDDGGSWAQQVYDPYDPCPNGLRPAWAGQYVVQGRAAPQQSNLPFRQVRYELTGEVRVSEGRIGEEGGFATDAPIRACVGNQVGQYTEQASSGDSVETYTVDVFDQVTWQNKQPPAAIDVYVNDTWERRVRY